MIAWLEEQPASGAWTGALTEAQKEEWKPRGTGLTKANLMDIIRPLKPAKKFSVYEIAGKYGNIVDITPSYEARSATVEVGWANTKNPISRQLTRSMAELEKQVMESVRTRLTEQMWLGAYRTSRQWQDAKYVQLQGWDAGLTAPRTGRFAEGDEAEAQGEGEGADVKGPGVRVDDDDSLLDGLREDGIDV